MAGVGTLGLRMDANTRAKGISSANRNGDITAMVTGKASA